MSRLGNGIRDIYKFGVLLDIANFKEELKDEKQRIFRDQIREKPL